MLKLSLGGTRFEWRLIREILRVGAPLSLQPILNNLGLTALTGFAGTLGATALAAFGSAVRLEYLLYPMTFGFGAALLAMVGTNIGAGNFARAARISWTAAGFAAAIASIAAAVAIFWPNVWTSLFTASPSVKAAAGTYLVVVGFAYPFVALNTLGSAFQAMGCPQWPILVFATRFVVTIVGGWIVIHATDTGLVGLGVATAAGLIISQVMLAIVYRAVSLRQAQRAKQIEGGVS